MTRTLQSARAALAAALGCVATVALAQLPPAQGSFTLVSASLPLANDFLCTVTNVSSQPVTLSLLEIVEDGLVRTNVLSACTGLLAAGERCAVRTEVYMLRGQVVPHCRARFIASQPGAMLGSFHGYYTSGGVYLTLAVLPLQPLSGVTLAGAMTQP